MGFSVILDPTDFQCLDSYQNIFLYIPQTKVSLCVWNNIRVSSDDIIFIFAWIIPFSVC